jgi:hypothetical protein
VTNRDWARIENSDWYRSLCRTLVIMVKGAGCNCAPEISVQPGADHAVVAHQEDCRLMATEKAAVENSRGSSPKRDR